MVTLLATGSFLCATAAIVIAWIEFNERPALKAAREEEEQRDLEDSMQASTCTSDEIGLWIGEKNK